MTMTCHGPRDERTLRVEAHADRRRADRGPMLVIAGLTFALCSRARAGRARCGARDRRPHTQRPERSQRLDHHLLDVPAADMTCQRQTRAGIVLRVTTSFAWLPRIKRPRPRRPCDAITIRSQPRALAVSIIPSAGNRLITCIASHVIAAFLAASSTFDRISDASLATALL